MGNYRNFTLATYFVAHAAAHVTREELEEQLKGILWQYPDTGLIIIDTLQFSVCNKHN